MYLKVSQSSLSLEYVGFLSLYFANNISVFLKLFEIISLLWNFKKQYFKQANFNWEESSGNMDSITDT